VVFSLIPVILEALLCSRGILRVLFSSWLRLCGLIVISSIVSIFTVDSLPSLPTRF